MQLSSPLYFICKPHESESTTFFLFKYLKFKVHSSHTFFHTYFSTLTPWKISKLFDIRKKVLSVIFLRKTDSFPRNHKKSLMKKPPTVYFKLG